MTDLFANEAVRIALLVLLFVAVAAVAFGLVATFGERQEMRERLAGSRQRRGPGRCDQSGRRFAFTTPAAPGSRWLPRSKRPAIPLVDTKDANIRSRLVAAGYTQEHAPRVYSLVRLIAGHRASACRLSA